MNPRRPRCRARLAVAVVMMGMRVRAADAHRGILGALARRVRPGVRGPGQRSAAPAERREPRARDAAVAADPERVVHRGGMVACARAAAAAGKRGSAMEKTALLVIDAQQEYFAPIGKVVLPDGPPAVARIARAPDLGPQRGPCRSSTSSTRAAARTRRRSRPAARRSRSIRPRAGARRAGYDQAPARLVHQHRARGAPPAARDRAGHRLGLHDPDVLRHDRARGGASRVQGPHGRGRHGRDGREGAGRAR